MIYITLLFAFLCTLSIAGIGAIVYVLMKKLDIAILAMITCMTPIMIIVFYLHSMIIQCHQVAR